MKISDLIRELKFIRKTINCDADVFFFANGYKKPGVEVKYTTKQGEVFKDVVIYGKYDIHPSIEQCRNGTSL